MFLNKLEKNTKDLFLKLCIHAALSNGVFADEQKEMVKAYCREMNIPEDIPEFNDTFEELLDQISLKTTNQEKKIIVLEILGLIKSDGIYDEKEKLFMKSLIKGINVNEDVLNKTQSLLEIYTVVCKELYTLISE